MKTPLQLSREHWQRLATGTTTPEEWIGPGQCALCQRYFHRNLSANNYCNGCPVKLKTGNCYCVGTPYEAVDDFVDSVLWDSDETDEQHSARIKNMPEFQALAQKELDFLNTLEEPTNDENTTQS